MSDYLSTLAARSLRREPACEPRRAQMFEPRHETPGAGIAEGVYEGPAGAETSEGFAPDLAAQARARPSHTPHDALQIPDARQTIRPQTSEDVPPVRETTTPRVMRRAQPQAVTGEARPYELEALPTAVAQTEAAGEPPAAHAPRDVSLIPLTPHQAPVNLLPPDTEPGYLVAQAADDSGPAYASLKPGDSPTQEREGRAAFDGEGREQTSPDGEGREQTSPSVRRANVEPPALKGSTTVVDLEVIPQPNTPMPKQAAETSVSNARPSLLPMTAEQTGGARGAGRVDVRATAREGVSQPTPPPTIEVTIGRIEVRAVTQPAAAPPPPRERREPPKMSLDDYLRAQGGGRG